MNAAIQLKILQNAFPMGKEITLTSNGVSVPTKALRGNTRGTMYGTDGTATEFETVDWLVTVDQLLPIGKPPRGATIVCGEESFSVGHPDQNSPSVVNHGNDGTAWRIHTVANP